MIGLLAAASLAAAQPAAAPVLPAELPRTLIFARTAIEGWRLEAITDVDNVAGFPMIRSAFCEMKRSGLKLTTWGDGGLQVRIGDDSVEPEFDFQPQQIRRLAIDDSVWQYRQLEDAWSDKFVNVAYPPHPCPGCPMAHAYTVAMRRRAGDPWLPPHFFVDALLHARVLRIGFEQEGSPRPLPPLLWAEVPLIGLDRAIAWCREALASEGVHRFHGGLAEE